MLRDLMEKMVSDDENGAIGTEGNKSSLGGDDIWSDAANAITDDLKNEKGTIIIRDQRRHQNKISREKLIEFTESLEAFSAQIDSNFNSDVIELQL